MNDSTASRLTPQLRIELLGALLRAHTSGPAYIADRFDQTLLGEMMTNAVDDEQLAALSLPLLEKLWTHLDARAKDHPNPPTVEFIRSHADRVLRVMAPKREAKADSDNLAKQLGVAIALCFALLFGGRAGAAEHVQIDQPDDWYRADVSHHGKHAVGGAVIGVASYAVVRASGGSRGDAVAVGVVDGFLAGCTYELVEGRDGRAWVDPVDALWTTAGAAVGAVTAAITDRAIGAAIAVTPRQDGFVVAWSHKF